MEEFIVVGLGGIGSVLCFGLPYSLVAAAQTADTRIILADGGDYKPDHIDHEYFTKLGKKADVQRSQLAASFPAMFFRSLPYYLTEKREANAFPVRDVIKENHWIFAGVDNHKTRKLLSDHCRTLANVTLISGGNEDSGSMVQVFIRRNGRDITPPLDFRHPDIANPTDESPVDRAGRGCPRRIQSGHQSPATLFATASLMLNAFHAARRLEKHGRLAQFPYREVYWDIGKAKMRAVPVKD